MKSKLSLINRNGNNPADHAEEYDQTGDHTDILFIDGLDPIDSKMNADQRTDIGAAWSSADPRIPAARN